MAKPRIVIVGAGPAGIRAAEHLVAAGFRPVVLDESPQSGGQIYRRQPKGFSRRPKDLYGFEAARATAVHEKFAELGTNIEFHPETSVWGVSAGLLHTLSNGTVGECSFDKLILATGATDRLIPVKGWTQPGSYTLGAAQIALKAQAISIGRKVVFMGTGPLLYLVAYQYLKAGIEVAAVLDTSAFGGQVKASAYLLSRPSVFLKGLYYRSFIAARGVPVRSCVTPLEIEGRDGVTAVRFRRKDGSTETVNCDAVGMGYHLRSETQLADLARCQFVFDSEMRQWRPQTDEDGRSSVDGIYLAGDGCDILGADAAEISGQLVAMALLSDLGVDVSEAVMEDLRLDKAGMARFRFGLNLAFPWPADLARATPDDTLVCRCEAITAGELRNAANSLDAKEVNRAKSFCRVGMGRCQGRYCGLAAAEILADTLKTDVQNVGRIRGQAPVKPLPIAVMHHSDEIEEM